MARNDAVGVPLRDCLRVTPHSPRATTWRKINMRDVGVPHAASSTHSLSWPSHQTVFLFVQLKGLQLLHEKNGVPPAKEYCRA